MYIKKSKHDFLHKAVHNDNTYRTQIKNYLRYPKRRLITSNRLYMMQCICNLLQKT